MQITTVAESLYWSYANLAMAHAAVEEGASTYGRIHFIIRSRLYKGLRDGSMNIGVIADDERLKLVLPQACCYCGAREHLSVDHLIARKRGGFDTGDNMVWSCRPCNSSKCANDVLEWLSARGEFPPLLLLRRYLKLAVKFCSEQHLMAIAITDVDDLPFTLSAIPHNFPAPCELALWRVPLSGATV
ncbi:MAG: HNH endonuclease [Bryobacteraceae bacterium]